MTKNDKLMQNGEDSFENRFQRFPKKNCDSVSDRLEKFSQEKSKQSQPAKASPLIQVQTLRVLELNHHLKENPVAILADPVGSGKTVVALSALRLLFESEVITRAVIVAPNRTVAQKWESEALALGFGSRLPLSSSCQMSFPESKKRPATQAEAGQNYKWPQIFPEEKLPEEKLIVVTRRELPKRKQKSIDEYTLFVIDEAHRGLHKADNDIYKTLRMVSQGAKMLLVSATPMQLSATGLIDMLSVALVNNAQSQWEPLKLLGIKVRAAFDVARKDYERSGRNAKAPLSEQAETSAEEAGQALAAARTAFEQCFLLPAYPRREAKIPDLPEISRTKIPLIKEDHPTKEPVPLEWAMAYQVARIVPELIDTEHGDMFRRRLVSSDRAFLHGVTGFKLGEIAKINKNISSLHDELKNQLSKHPKLERTVQWIMHKDRSNRHVLVFCVFKDTQTELKKRLEGAINFKGRLFAPDDATELSNRGGKDFLKAFRKEVSHNKQPPRCVLIVRDNLSESIDLDGGNPCIVHYDLAWNPVRLVQRYGRVVRASSGFTPLKPKDIFLPYLDVEVDRRLAETIHGRAEMAGLLLPTESCASDGETQDRESDDHAWAVPVEVLEIIRKHSRSIDP